MSEFWDIALGLGIYNLAIFLRNIISYLPTIGIGLLILFVVGVAYVIVQVILSKDVEEDMDKILSGCGIILVFVFLIVFGIRGVRNVITRINDLESGTCDTYDYDYDIQEKLFGESGPPYRDDIPFLDAQFSNPCGVVIWATINRETHPAKMSHFYKIHEIVYTESLFKIKNLLPMVISFIIAITGIFFVGKFLLGTKSFKASIENLRVTNISNREVVAALAIVVGVILLYSNLSSDCELPYDGVYIKERRCSFNEIPRGTGSNPSSDIPNSDNTKPIIAIWEPTIDLSGLFLEDDANNNFDFYVSSEEGFLEITPRQELEQGYYCFIASNILMRKSQAPRWCFSIGSVSISPAELSESETSISEITQTPTETLSELKFYVNEIYYGKEAMQLISYVNEFMFEPDPGWQRIAILLTVENTSNSYINFGLIDINNVTLIDSGGYEHSVIQRFLEVDSHASPYLSPGAIFPIIFDSEIAVNQTPKTLSFNFHNDNTGITRYEIDVSQPEGLFYFPFKSPIDISAIGDLKTSVIENLFPNDFEYELNYIGCMDYKTAFELVVTNLGGEDLIVDPKNSHMIYAITMDEVGFYSTRMVSDIENSVIGPTITKTIDLGFVLPIHDKIESFHLDYSNYYFINFSIWGNSYGTHIELLVDCESGVYHLR